MSEKKGCLWCRKSFSWDPGMFPYCDRCIGMLETLENVLYEQGVTGKRINLARFLEEYLGSVDSALR